MIEGQLTNGFKFSFAEDKTKNRHCANSTPKFNSIEMSSNPTTLPSGISDKKSKKNVKSMSNSNEINRESSYISKIQKISQIYQSSHSRGINQNRNKKKLKIEIPARRIRTEPKSDGKFDEKKVRKAIYFEEIAFIKEQLVNSLKIKGQSKKQNLNLNDYEVTFSNMKSESPKSFQSLKVRNEWKQKIKSPKHENIINAELLPLSTKSRKQKYYFKKQTDGVHEKSSKFHFNKMIFNRLKKKIPQTKISEISLKIEKSQLQ